MKNLKAKINIENYFKKGTGFIIPAYQRGYKWGLSQKGGESAASFLFKNIKEAYVRGDREYFIEAVTVVKNNDRSYTLVDGQQRTTTLYLLLYCLGETQLLQGVTFNYTIRKDSHLFLSGLTSAETNIHDEDVQDIAAFKHVLKIFKTGLSELNGKYGTPAEDLYTFASFLKERVWLLINEIPPEKALSVFISMNGLRAVMKPEELIKSDILIKSSTQEKTNTLSDHSESFGLLWKITSNRAMLARNWDKWLYWWNKPGVKSFFKTGNRHPLYFLLVVHWTTCTNKGASSFNFSAFKSEFLTTPEAAKQTFEKLRKLQKTFEDLYNDPEAYNLLGMVFSTAIERTACLKFFINHHKSKADLQEFSKWAAAGCNISEITAHDTSLFKNRRDALKNELAKPDVFNSTVKEQVYLQLLRMNIGAMNNRKFDFEIFGKKSLEHVCPQNPDKGDNIFNAVRNEINDIYNINSIGNLVLLNGSVNSALSNENLKRKKEILFDKIKDGFMLPHTLKVFSKSFGGDSGNMRTLFDPQIYWQAEDVGRNNEYFMKEFDLYFLQ